MPTDNAELVISCRSTGTAEVEHFTNAVRNADQASNQLVKTLGGLFSAGMVLRWGTQAVQSFRLTQDAAWQFSQTYQKVSDEAEAAAKRFMSVYDLSEKSAKSMLSMSGDLLKGFGFSEDVSLKFAEAAAKMGTDLAGYRNYAGGAEGATQALTAAMLGNTRMMMGLGVVIHKDDALFKELTKAFQGGGLSVDQIRQKLGEFSTTDENVKAQWESMIKLFASGKRLTQQQADALTTLFVTLKQTKQAVGDTIKEGESFSQTLQRNEQASFRLSSHLGEMVYKTLSLNDAVGLTTRGMNDLSEWYENASPEVKRATGIFVTSTGVMLALKAAAAGYHVLSGMSAAVSNRAASAASEESKAHIANAQALRQEADARTASAAAIARRQQLYDRRSGLISEAKTAVAVRSTTSAMAPLNGAIAKVNGQVALMNRSLVATGSAAVVGKIKAGIVGIAAATKTATLAAVGLAKAFLPMLAISAVIAGVDYLINRSKVAAQGQNDLSAARLASAEKAAAAEAEKRAEDEKNIEVLKTLQSYTNLTSEEQETAKDIIGKLSERYGDLSKQISIVNGQLVVAKDAWKDLNEEQLKNYVASEQAKANKAHKAALSMMQNFGKANSNYLTRGAKRTFSEWSVIESNIDNAMMFGDIEKQIYFMEAALEKARINGYTEEKAYIQEIIDLLEKEKAARDAVAAAQKKQVVPGSGGDKPVFETTAELDKKYKQVLGNFQKRKDQRWWDNASDEDKLSDLYGREYELYQKFNDARERAPKSRAAQIEAVQYAEQLLEIEEKRAEVMRNAERKRAEELEKTANEEMQFYNQILNSAMRIRATAANGVDANSTEAIRMQSRATNLDGKGLHQAAQQAAEAAKRAADAQEKAKEDRKRTADGIAQICTLLENAGISTL